MGRQLRGNAGRARWPPGGKFGGGERGGEVQWRRRKEDDLHFLLELARMRV